jgi:hypothetical protein
MRLVEFGLPDALNTSQENGHGCLNFDLPQLVFCLSYQTQRHRRGYVPYLRSSPHHGSHPEDYPRDDGFTQRRSLSTKYIGIAMSMEDELVELGNGDDLS